MANYGQYCPMARALELVGERWTLLIVRDMLSGVHRFNDLERGLPGISRALLSARLGQLRRAGLVEKQASATRRGGTEYHLTPAGLALMDVVASLWTWGNEWAFGEPAEEELNPILLMWWLRTRAAQAERPEKRVICQFDFSGRRGDRLWLMSTPEEVTICLTDPGYGIDLLVAADLPAIFKVWAGRLTWGEALRARLLRIDGPPALVRAFPAWFGWSTANEPEKTIPQKITASR